MEVAVIKEFEEQNREALRKLYLEVRKTNFVWLSKEARATASFDADTEGELLLVAWLKGRIVGFISIWLPDNFIHHLYVDNAYQRKGIGKQLLDKTIPIIGLPATLKCMKANPAALRFYTRNGWTAREEGITDEGAFVLFQLSP